MVPLVLALLGLFSVSVVTAAPVASSNEEMLVNLAQLDGAADRAKRADEEILFFNEQNKQRMVAKKSGPGPVIAPSEPEVDEGAEVIVHKQQPVTSELKERLDSAQEDSEKDEEYAKELESSMQSIVNSVLEDGSLEEPAEEDTPQEVSEVEEEQGEATDGASQEREEEEEEVPNSDEAEDEAIISDEPIVAEDMGSESLPLDVNSSEGDVDEEMTPEVVEDAEVVEMPAEDDDAEKDLQVVSLGNEAENTGDEDEAANQLVQESDDVTGDLVPDVSEVKETYTDLGGYTEPPNVLYDYLNAYSGYPKEYQQTNMDPYFLARRRRSLVKARRNRRIKRDLLDDGVYNLYDSAPPETYYPPEEVSEEDKLVLTDREASLLFSSLLDYIEEALTDEEIEALKENEQYAGEDVGVEEEEAPMPYEPEYLPAEVPQQYEEPTQYLGQEPSYALPYEDAYPYAVGDLDAYSNDERGREMYYPEPVERKRSSSSYAFPYAAEEPDARWGAFLPQKRDYKDAIQRLQRLSMALSDDPSLYLSDVADEYKKK